MRRFLSRKRCLFWFIDEYYYTSINSYFYLIDLIENNIRCFGFDDSFESFAFEFIFN